MYDLSKKLDNVKQSMSKSEILLIEKHRLLTKGINDRAKRRSLCYVDAEGLGERASESVKIRHVESNLRQDQQVYL